MLEIRRSEDRGAANHGWLNSQHTFSFADYYDPKQMGFGPLRVINEDRVQAGRGFATHSHRDMEIISYVLEGALEHKDSLGTGSVLHYGDVQRMSAGTGVRHSEFNHSTDEDLHFLQIWIEPKFTGLRPSYEEKHFEPESKRGKLLLVASADGRDGSVLIHQNASMYASILDEDDAIEYAPVAGRRAYLHLICGKLSVNGTTLRAGDALKVSDETLLKLGAAEKAELLLFDLPF
jgi:redox-sensitive bicupin YhaK (pirin superfamily)